MPFYSRDWRSPGELWIKTDDGWEKRKILEFDSTFSERLSTQSLDRTYGLTSIERSQSSPCANTDLVIPPNSSPEQLKFCQPEESAEAHSATSSDSRGNFTPPPYCQITVKPSREVGGCTGFSEVFKRLDFKSALHDSRRFNYVSKLLELLVTRSLLSLAGTAQRVVFSLLEELAMSVSNTKCNVRLLNQLVTNLRLIMAKKYCFGQLLGSSSLWKLNEQSLERVEQLDRQVCQCLSDGPGRDEGPALLQLPAECIRHVLLCLADHRDLESAAGAARQLAPLAGEAAVWHQLCLYHFSCGQIDTAVQHLARGAARGGGTCGSSQGDPLSPRAHEPEQDAAVVPESSGGDSLSARAHEPEQDAAAVPGSSGGDSLSPRAHEPEQDAAAVPRTSSGDSSSCIHSSADCDEVRQETASIQQIDWKSVYHRLRREHGLREEYAECVMLCRVCRTLFWRPSGHPCTVNDSGSSETEEGEQPSLPRCISVPPRTLLTFLSL